MSLCAAVMPLPWRALPLVIFLLGIPLDTLVSTLFPFATAVAILLYPQHLLLAVAWALLGYALWSETDEDDRRRPAPA